MRGSEAIVAAFMRAYGTPGIAVAVVRPGRPAFVRGYGVRTLGRPERVDAHTRFAIASHTKAFTAVALALPVDEGRIGWENPVVRHVPHASAKGAGEDAIVTFAVRDGRVTGVTMKALAPLADFRCDVRHLAFAPVR